MPVVKATNSSDELTKMRQYRPTGVKQTLGEAWDKLRSNSKTKHIFAKLEKESPYMSIRDAIVKLHT
jgi:RecB family exonuclease